MSSLFSLALSIKRKYYNNYNLITQQNIWHLFRDILDPEGKIKLLYKPSFKNKLLSEQNIEKSLRLICKKCDHKISPYFGKKLCMFWCVDCDIHYFICTSCLNGDISRIDFSKKEFVFEANLMRLVRHHNYSHYFLSNLICSLFPNEEYREIYKNDETTIFIENGRLYMTTITKRSLSGGAKVIKTPNFPENFIFRHGEMEISNHPSSHRYLDLDTEIHIKNGNIFYHKENFGPFLGSYQNLPTFWECKVHGVYHHDE